MRSTCGAQLGVLTGQLAGLCRQSSVAIAEATRALLDTDLPLAEKVIGDHADVASGSAAVEEDALVLLTLHAPLARDLRTIVGAIQITADIERMGVLAQHIAEIARRRHPRSALPTALTSHFADMGRIAADLAAGAYESIVSCDPGRARFLSEGDEGMDRLHRQLFTVTMDRGWEHGAATAVDVMLLGRYYERFADHAVRISRRIVFQATGQLPRE